MLNIVLPIAGRGSRFVEADHGLSEPLIPLHGMPMFEAVVRNVRPSMAHRIIVVAERAHLDCQGMREAIERAAPGAVVVAVDPVTDGAACTVLLARDHIDTDAPLMVANSEQWVDVAIDDYLATMPRLSADGLIMTMTTHDPKCMALDCPATSSDSWPTPSL